jgi:hypothetical protein
MGCGQVIFRNAFEVKLCFVAKFVVDAAFGRKDAEGYNVQEGELDSRTGGDAVDQGKDIRRAVPDIHGKEDSFNFGGARGHRFP